MLALTLIILSLLISPQLAEAQTSRNPCYTTGPQGNTGLPNCISVGTYTSTNAWGPLPVGGLANAAAPTYTEGMIGGLSFDLGGALRVSSGGGGITAAVTVANGADVAEGSTTDTPASTPTGAGAATIVSLLKSIANSNVAAIPAGANVIGKVGIDQTTPGTTNLVSLSPETTKVIGTVNQGTSPWVVSGSVTASFTPSSSSSIGITPVVSTAAEASHVLKASPGNVYSAYANNFSATAGWLVLINATSAPADGAITPLACALLSPNGVSSINYAPGPPGVFSVGITAVVTSATTCFTKTTGIITAFISGSVQ